MKDIKDIVGPTEGNLLFKEYRRSNRISALSNNNIDHWYEDEQTFSLNYTYSSITVKEDGKNVLLIGVNPRDDLRLGNINEQVHAYINNPIKLMHRTHLKDSLEPTRRNSIIASHKISDDGVKSLLTLDLFVYRTLTSGELKDIIRARTIPACNIIGNLNRKVLMEYVADDDIDYIILGWGNLGSDIWNSLGAYRDELYDALKNKIDKCYWFGATGSGCPRHPSASNSLSKGLTRVSRQELYNALH